MLCGWINTVSKHDLWDQPAFVFGKFDDGRVSVQIGQVEFAERVTQEQAEELIAAWELFQMRLYEIVSKFDGQKPD